MVIVTMLVGAIIATAALLNSIKHIGETIAPGSQERQELAAHTPIAADRSRR